jgi:hypothetical protein
MIDPLGHAIVVFSVCIACLSCDRKQQVAQAPASGGGTGNTAASSNGSAQGTPAQPQATAPSAAAVPAGADSLPRAEDVLPDGEVSAGSLAVIGDGYRFQVKPGFKPVPHAVAKTAYVGTVEGIIAPAELTLFVTRQPFGGDQDALAKRQMDTARARNGKISLEGPALNGYRFLATGEGKLDMQLIAVDNGTGYVFHAQTPDVPNAYANVGSDLAIRASTFRVGKFEPKQPGK